MSAQSSPVATDRFRAGNPVSLTEAARRTGLADSGAAMAQRCAGTEVPVYDGPRSGGYLSLASFVGAAAVADLGEITVVESGRL